MEVTDLKYPLENKLVKRLDKFIKMTTRTKQIQDVLFTVHGKTGTGKTNASLVMAYYIKSKTGRDIHLFFSTGKACEYAKDTKEKIIIIDEPSLDSLSKDQMTKVNKNFMRLLNTMRQKRHTIIVNITRFWRFPFDLVVDRSLAMINVFNKGGKDLGRFHFIRQRRLEYLWNEFQRIHKKVFTKVKSFGGWFPERMETEDENGQKYFDKMGIIINEKRNCTYEDYKEFRDKEITQIGTISQLSKKEIDTIKKYAELKYKIAHLHKRFPSIHLVRLAEYLGIDHTTLRNWGYSNQFIQNSPQNSPISLENQGFETDEGTKLVISMGDNQKNFSASSLSPSPSIKQQIKKPSQQKEALTA